jgi:hypothetical protein
MQGVRAWFQELLCHPRSTLAGDGDRSFSKGMCFLKELSALCRFIDAKQAPWSFQSETHACGGEIRGKAAFHSKIFEVDVLLKRGITRAEVDWALFHLRGMCQQEIVFSCFTAFCKTSRRDWNNVCMLSSQKACEIEMFLLDQKSCGGEEPILWLNRAGCCV